MCGKFLNLAHYFPYDVKLRLLAHSQSFSANRKARNAIVGAENLLDLLSFQFGLDFFETHLTKIIPQLHGKFGLKQNPELFSVYLPRDRWYLVPFSSK